MQNPNVSIAQRLEYFDGIISPKACFAGGRRSIYRNDLRSMDVASQRGITIGMKSSTLGMDPNHGRKFACDTTGIFHRISENYPCIVGSNGCRLGNYKGTHALAARKIAEIVWLNLPS